MKKVIKQLISATLAFTLLAACQKSNDSTATTDEVSIIVSSPQEGQQFRSGDTVSIAASINSTKMLHGYTVSITDNNGVKVYETEGHSHSGTIEVNEVWVDTLNTATDLNLEITAVLDHDESLKKANVAFTSQP